jgi:hypothetical protein
MKPDYLSNARAILADAIEIAILPLPHIAACEAYFAVFHAAEACLFEHTGKVAKIHRGARGEFARLMDGKFSHESMDPGSITSRT